VKAYHRCQNVAGGPAECKVSTPLS
jgi:hypothetical protein